MNCVASTYDASGKLVGCTEQELISVISVQMYTLFAVGTGLYLYKTFTAENWVDIAVTIGWGCISTFTRTKRVVTKYVLPGLYAVFQTLYDTTRTTTATEDVVTEDLIRVVKDGVETLAYSSVFEFVHDLDERFKKRAISDVVDEDVINVHLCDTETEAVASIVSSEASESSESIKEAQIDEAQKEEEEEEEDEEYEEEEDEEEEDEEEEEEEEDEDDEEEDISELLTRIENHTMQFDFMLSRVPTAHDHVNPDSKDEGGYVMKYDGFPRDSLGVHFYDRKFVPVDHRMMEVVLHHEGKEYDLNLASPDNFYVAGNKLLDPAFVKWFMLKNHGIHISTRHGCNPADKCSYVIKCVDHAAGLHTLHPHNYLHVSVSGFEVQDSGLV
jgi:hypothetical protein